MNKLLEKLEEERKRLKAYLKVIDFFGERYTLKYRKFIEGRLSLVEELIDKLKSREGRKGSP